MEKTPRTEEAESASLDHVFLTVATRIREARQRLKLTQKQVAELAGFQHSYVYEIETGRTNITLRTFVKLAEVLQTDIRALLPETGPDVVSPDDISIFRAILDKAIAVLADYEEQDAERHRQDAERYKQDVERLQRQSALLRELKSFVALQKYVEKAASPVRELTPAKAPVADAERGGVERTGRPPKAH
jgi:transcriptional regulator with XRE-family HTH domain